ncbi:hypothetical protein ACFOEM_04305 [Paenalcaligenes hominis]|uniref:hypothetical protein n=1 Tax=Paenalcaligenes hominis TaxID=643674 RepID=UPI0036152BC2
MSARVWFSVLLGLALKVILGFTWHVTPRRDEGYQSRRSRQLGASPNKIVPQPLQAVTGYVNPS